MDEAGKQRAAQYVSEQMASRGWTPNDLADQADVNIDTIRTLLNGTRWPWPGNQKKIENALGVPVGTIGVVAAGRYQDSDMDPVEQAIRSSKLSRANQNKLVGTYFEMLDQEEVRGA